MDTNVIALAQQLQDVKDGLAAAQALLQTMGGVSIGGVTLGALAAYAWRHKWLNSTLATHLEDVAVSAVVAGKGMAETMASEKKVMDTVNAQRSKTGSEP